MQYTTAAGAARTARHGSEIERELAGVGRWCGCRAHDSVRRRLSSTGHRRLGANLLPAGGLACDDIAGFFSQTLPATLPPWALISRGLLARERGQRAGDHERLAGQLVALALDRTCGGVNADLLELVYQRAVRLEG